jgi:glycogen debranching enzyme
VTEPWTFAGTPSALFVESVVVMEGTTFCIGDRAGNLGGVRSGGLFVRDTRVLQGWDLTVDGRPVDALTVHHDTPHSALHVGHVRGPAPEAPTELLVTRHRVVGDGMREEITVVNCDPRPRRVELVLRVRSDLADLFEVKDGRAHGNPLPGRVVNRNHLQVTGVPDTGYAVEVVPASDAVASPDGFRWEVTLAAHESWSTTLEVIPRIQGDVIRPHHPRDLPIRDAVPYQRRAAWWSAAPQLDTPDGGLRETLRRSVEDLGTLRIFEAGHPERPVVAAGAPWFMALFGRDSLITSMMLMPLDVELAKGTCEILADHQGRVCEELTEEEPGKILHELRLGPAGTLALGGGSAYYGSVDATPLFVMAIGELLRWRGPEGLSPELVAAADRALDWMVEYGDLDGDGFVEYVRKTPQGLRNQGWKDSWDGVNFADGALAEAPIALAEVQGYVHAAFRARAEIADALEDGHGAAQWRARADRLKDLFDARFWLPDVGWYAAGLDHDKRPIDAVTSALGHLLWTDIVIPERAERVAQLLVSPELFSGWGIRTLASTMGRYDPMSYHNGSVWPHDTAICVSGLARYGFRAEASRVASGLLDAAGHFGNRLPELFAGFDRRAVPVPVPYPAACSPQAWAASAPVELLRALLRLEPGEPGPHCDPALPDRFVPLRLSGLRYRGDSYQLDVDIDGLHRIHREQ